MRRITRAFALAGLLLAAATLSTPPTAPAQPQAGRFTRTEAMVTMRDGVKLYTTVYAPKAAKGRLPIILVRSPYGIDGRPERNFRDYLKAMVDDGYVFVFQDIRGRFRS